MGWLLIGLIILAVALLIWATTAKTEEQFMTMDMDTATAQRQQLQMEGERRYNDIGRLQVPGGSLPPDLIDAAVTQPLAKPSSATTSLLTLVNSSLGLGAGASGSRGASVEQTGAVAEKIQFCESLPLNCSTLDDPRMAECGFCHRDGIDSTGKAHRGGMYISADDIIRANQRAEGGTAAYQPTVGTCKPQNFTMMRDNCTIREKQLVCQSAGAATAANECGQCYGAAPAGATGLLYVGPKPRTFTAVLVLSHPGMHNYQGTGTIVTMPDGSTINVATSSNQLIAPTTVYLNNMKEGDTIGIKVFGLPKVWCAWLTSPDGNRSVGIDIGLQNESANPGMVIAGDKRSSAVTNAIDLVMSTVDSNAWASFQSQIPNTVMWYARRDEILQGGITSAIYGNIGNASVDVTSQMKSLAGAYVDVTVSPNTFGNDPQPGTPKNLAVYLDNRQTFNVADGQTIPKQRFNNTVNLQVTIPATLVDPAFPDDKADCPTGPIVFTEVGAGLMGSHSCFKPDGSFNPTAYCLQELFIAAGGSQGGTDYPSTDAKAAALVVNNSLDDTVADLNNRGSIAQYGFDSNGVAADFGTLQKYSMQMLGRTPANPCDTANSATGTQTAECLDFLWRTAGASSMPQLSATATMPGYDYCSKGAPGAPLNADGSVNEANAAAANALGSVAAIKQAYATLHGRTQNSANFDDQNAAMQQCFGTTINPPPLPPLSCVPEVFNICPGGGYTLTSDEAAATCQAAGARLATPDEITQAQKLGANWCACGWASDGNAYYPMNKVLPEYGYGCGDPHNMGVRSCGNMSGSWANGKACATCFGVKPKASTNPPGVMTFNSDYKTAAYRMTSPGYDEGSGAGQTCFDNLTVEDAQKQCSSMPDCKSFSFAAAQVGVPMDRGGGCFKMDYVGSNPNPAYVGFTKMPPPPSVSTWNAPLIPQIGNLFTFKNAGNNQGMFHHEGANTMMVGSTITPSNSTFNIVAGNNGQDGYISLMSYDTPNNYIRHSSFVAILNPKDGSDIFNKDSSFMVVPSLNNKPNMFSLQSFNFPDHYLMCSPINPDQIVLKVPGASTDLASWYGVIPQMLTQ